MLQARGQVTAAEVAEELEVSERTARRDLDALGVAGLPIYSMQGRNGGWKLAGGGRTDLSGLTAAKARALFLVAGPSSSATPEMRAALRKLVRALPESFRDAAEATTTRSSSTLRGGTRPSASAPTRPISTRCSGPSSKANRCAGYVARTRGRAARRAPVGAGGQGIRPGTSSPIPRRACARSGSTA